MGEMLGNYTVKVQAHRGYPRRVSIQHRPTSINSISLASQHNWKKTIEGYWRGPTLSMLQAYVGWKLIEQDKKWEKKFLHPSFCFKKKLSADQLEAYDTLKVVIITTKHKPSSTPKLIIPPTLTAWEEHAHSRWKYHLLQLHLFGMSVTKWKINKYPKKPG